MISWYHQLYSCYYIIHQIQLLSISYYHPFCIQPGIILLAYAVATFDSLYRVHMMTDSYAVQVLGNKAIELANVVIHMWTFFCNFCFHELLTCWIKLSLNLNQKSSWKIYTPTQATNEGEKKVKHVECWRSNANQKNKILCEWNKIAWNEARWKEGIKL